ncbi:MAG: alpha/beta hydrolase [Gemmatimonadetes bacterium]|nr:alpha/beta hydrolase [Gemmatimonadota bacterium]
MTDRFTSDNHPFVTPDVVNALPSKPADFRSSYGSEPPQFGELRLPAGRGPYPVAVVLHGGCWLSVYADLRNADALGDALRDEGIATWNVEYRCVDQEGGGWPGTFHDAGNATDHLRTLSADQNLDLDRVITIGHSAGGHLALWTAARHRLPTESPLWTADPLPLRGTVVLGGPGDLKRFVPHADAECRQGVVAELLGGAGVSSEDEGKRVKGRFRCGSPMELLPLGIPQLLISGEHDWVVPPELGEAYEAAAHAAGDPAEHIIIPNAGHHEFMVPGSVTWPTVRQAVHSLIEH